MKSTAKNILYFLTGAVCLLWTTAAFCEDAPAVSNDAAVNAADATSEAPQEEEELLSVEAARERAKIMQEIYIVTLDVIHHRYFLNDRATVPARAMEDVFSQMARRSNINARWIAVNAKAMSIDHKPQDEFEVDAAKVLSRGESEFERVEGGSYRRAVSISLANGCLSCHGSFGRSSIGNRFAGLVISIPVAVETTAAENVAIEEVAAEGVIEK